MTRKTGSEVDIDNLEAWAMLQGYDPAIEYRQQIPLPPGYISPHFREAEFRCNHCGELPASGIDPALLDVLEDVRTHFEDKPVIINSGYRCVIHNANVGGAKNSQHLYGKAADISVKNVPHADVYAYLDPNHTGGLGKYKNFTHIDTRGSRARWSG